MCVNAFFDGAVDVRAERFWDVFVRLQVVGLCFVKAQFFAQVDAGVDALLRAKLQVAGRPAPRRTRARLHCDGVGQRKDARNKTIVKVDQRINTREQVVDKIDHAVVGVRKRLSGVSCFVEDDVRIDG